MVHDWESYNTQKERSRQDIDCPADRRNMHQQDDDRLYNCKNDQVVEKCMSRYQAFCSRNGLADHDARQCPSCIRCHIGPYSNHADDHAYCDKDSSQE